MLHGKNRNHNTEQCRTLKRESKKIKKYRNDKRSKGKDNEIHTMLEYFKTHIKKENNSRGHTQKVVHTFDKLSVSGDKMSE